PFPSAQRAFYGAQSGRGTARICRRHDDRGAGDPGGLASRPGFAPRRRRVRARLVDGGSPRECLEQALVRARRAGTQCLGTDSLGTLFLFLLAVGFERGATLNWTPRSIFAVSYLAVLGTALAFAGLFWLIPRVPVSVIGTIPLTDTVIAIALGVVILSERLSARAIVGTLMILGGVGMTVSRSGVRRGPAAP